jgi:hypothetical protein
MKSELDALARNHTWEVVDLPNGQRPIGCEWVFRIKYKQDGTIDRFKARLVAKGFTQVHGLDYQETYSPVARMSTLCLLLAISAAKLWYLHQLDIDNTFLHGYLSEEVYMKIPLGFKTSKPNQVCFLKRSLYGLKQASHQWFSTISAALTSQNYFKSPADHTLFIKRTSTSFTALLIYVDDVVLAGNCVEEIHSIKHFLHSKFKIKDLGELHTSLVSRLLATPKESFLISTSMPLTFLVTRACLHQNLPTFLWTLLHDYKEKWKHFGRQFILSKTHWTPPLPHFNKA